MLSGDACPANKGDLAAALLCYGMFVKVFNVSLAVFSHEKVFALSREFLASAESRSGFFSVFMIVSAMATGFMGSK